VSGDGVTRREASWMCTRRKRRQLREMVRCFLASAELQREDDLCEGFLTEYHSKTPRGSLPVDVLVVSDPVSDTIVKMDVYGWGGRDGVDIDIDIEGTARAWR